MMDIFQNKVYEIIRELQANGSTIFMSSHNLSEVERICHRAAIIKGGKLIAVEEINKLRGKKMHFVTVKFSGDFRASDFNFGGVKVNEKLPDGLVLNVKGDIDPLIKKIAEYKIKDLEITHASLEEVFLEFYKN
ncbi:MAG: ABC transporter ATP-binding protein, partial [Patescibacteria group bacterium]|nr:ABC transporter ATP-binding protein [Patescibacteria group bacterium]